MKYFNATGLAEVVDPHEIFYHCLKAIQHSLLIKMLQSKHEVEPENDQENAQERLSTEKDQRDVLYHHERTEGSTPETLMQEPAVDPHSFNREPSATRNYDALERYEDPCSSFSHERTLSSDTSASYHTAHSRRSTSPESQSGHDQENGLEAPADRSCYPSHTSQRSCARIRDPYQNLSNLHRDIILSINKNLENMATYTRSDELRDGVHIERIVSGLQTEYNNHLDKQQFWDAIEYLLDEAYIFTTIDDRHYNVLDLVN